MKTRQIVIQDFTGVYAEQPFMQRLRELAGQESARRNAEIRYIDCTGLPGTDCYCDDEAVESIRKGIAEAGITDAHGIHFFDNGNYHYMSKIWTDMVQEPFTLVVFDHHPDMQEPRFGNILSCGGWVKKVLEENKFVDNVVIIGAADHLVEEIPPHDKVTFIRESEIISLSSLVSRLSSNLYISIDKDALSHAYAATNWDQGSLRLEHMKSIISEIAKDHRIIGVDICGERAYDFEGNEQYTVSQADALNNRTNRELVDFFRNLLNPSRG